MRCPVQGANGTARFESVSCSPSRGSIILLFVRDSATGFRQLVLRYFLNDPGCGRLFFLFPKLCRHWLFLWAPPVTDMLVQCLGARGTPMCGTIPGASRVPFYHGAAESVPRDSGKKKSVLPGWWEVCMVCVVCVYGVCVWWCVGCVSGVWVCLYTVCVYEYVVCDCVVCIACV